MKPFISLMGAAISVITLSFISGKEEPLPLSGVDSPEEVANEIPQTKKKVRGKRKK